MSSADLSWDDLRVFLAIADAGSVSRAAKRLRVGQPALSRRLALLEHRVGAKLFVRTPRGLSLTTSGERLLTPAKKMAEWAGEAGRVVEATDSAPTGVVRFTASPWISHQLLAPFSAWLTEQAPGLSLDLISSMEFLDLARGEADLALRLRPPGAELVVLEKWALQTRVVIARKLASRLPKRPALEALPWVTWSKAYEELPPGPQLRSLVPGLVPALTADNFVTQYAAAVAGAGAMILFELPGTTLDERLVTLPVETPTVPLFLLGAKSAPDTARVRRVVQLLQRFARGDARRA